MGCEVVFGFWSVGVSVIVVGVGVSLSLFLECGYFMVELEFVGVWG